MTENTRSTNEKQYNLDDLQQGDEVTVQLQGKVVDQMGHHDELIMIQVDGMEIEVLSDEIVNVDQPARAVDIEETDNAE